MVKVSVIVPVYNPGEGINKCIQSLRNQSLSDIEMIFVDDCGTDNTMDIIRAKAEEDSRIRYLVNPQNMGAGASRNRGIHAAKGEYLAFVDPDDYIADDFLELLYNEGKNTGADIVKGDLIWVDEEGNSIWGDKRAPENSYISRCLEKGIPLYTLFVYQHTSAIYRRSYIEAEGIEYGKTQNAEDVTFLLKVCYPAKVVGFVDEAKYYYVKRQGSSVRTFTEKRLRNEIIELKDRLDFINCHFEDTDWQRNYVSRQVDGRLRIQQKLLYQEGSEDRAKSFLQEIRDVVASSPYIEKWAEKDVILRALYQDGTSLVLFPYGSGEWRETPYREFEDNVLRWIDYVNAHPEYSDECKDHLSIVFEKALYYKDWTDNQESRQAYKRLREIAHQLPDPKVLTRDFVAMRLFVDYGINLFALRKTFFGRIVRKVLSRVRKTRWMFHKLIRNAKSGIKKLRRWSLTHLPLRNLIIMESYPDCAGNTKEVFDELIRRGWNNKYRFVWWLQSSEPEQHEKIHNVVYLKGGEERQDAIKLAKLIVTENNYLYKPREKQYQIHIFHGAALKKVTNYYSVPDTVNEVISLTPYLLKEDAQNNDCPIEKMKPLGFPRNDVLLRERKPLGPLFPDHAFTKVIYWLPTYRQHRNGKLTFGSISMPVLHDDEAAEQVNAVAKANDVLIVVKPHFGQDKSLIQYRNLSNLIFIDDDFLLQRNLVNYDLLRDADALLSDYSSVYYDYLLVDRPIGLCWEDIEEYREREGFSIDLDSVMRGGEKLYTTDDVCAFIARIAQGTDALKAERREIRDLLFPNPDKPSTAVVVDYIEGILRKL